MPRHCQSDSDLELDLRENGKHQIFSQICRDHPACGCAPAYSSWNCDGEILNHTAIDVRYHSHPQLFCQIVQPMLKYSLKTLNLSLLFPECTASWSTYLHEESRSRRCSRISLTPVQYRPHNPVIPCQTLESSLCSQPLSMSLLLLLLPLCNTQQPFNRRFYKIYRVSNKLCFYSTKITSMERQRAFLSGSESPNRFLYREEVVCSFCKTF